MLEKKKNTALLHITLIATMLNTFFKRRNRLSLNDGLILLFTFKVLYSMAPDYLRWLVYMYMYLWPLSGNNLQRNCDPGVLMISPTARTKKTFGGYM